MGARYPRRAGGGEVRYLILGGLAGALAEGLFLVLLFSKVMR